MTGSREFAIYFQHPHLNVEATERPFLHVSISTIAHECVGIGPTKTIEYAAKQIAYRPARGFVHRQLIGPDPMIAFPNHSRSYDRTRRAVRFRGYDSAIEASFFIDEDALMRLQPGAGYDESGFLEAFDSNRDLICAAATKVYVRGSRGSYDLVAADF